jgi:hypothetical protein
MIGCLSLIVLPAVIAVRTWLSVYFARKSTRIRKYSGNIAAVHNTMHHSIIRTPPKTSHAERVVKFVSVLKENWKYI